jgi:peroxiredoxin
MIKKGNKAPDFTLKDQDNHEVKPTDYEGKRLLLSFHPMAWTSVCAEQMKSLEANLEEFEKLNTVALGISVDTVPSKKAWAKELSITTTRLLSDFWPHGAVAQAYGIFRDKIGTSERANVVIDEKEVVVFFKVYDISQLPDIKEIIDILKK